MRVLFLSQGRDLSDQPGFELALAKRKAKERDFDYRNIPYLREYKEGGLARLRQRILQENEDFSPDMVFFQFFHSIGNAHPQALFREIKRAKNHPLVFGSLGDPFWTGWRSWFAISMPASVMELAAEADAFFSTSMGNIADALVESGGRNVVFLPNAFSVAHFPDWEIGLEREKLYDVCMVGSKCRLISRRFVSSYKKGWKRLRTAEFLNCEFGERCAIFGNGWCSSSAKGPIPFRRQVEIFQQSRVSVDTPAPIMSTYYTSDRAYFIAGSGTPLVEYYIPRLEKLLKEDEHAYFIRDLKQLVPTCKKILSIPQDVLAERRRRTLEYIHTRNRQEHRVDTIISAAEAIMAHRGGLLSAEEALHKLRLWHFHQDVDLEDEQKYAIRNWVG